MRSDFNTPSTRLQRATKKLQDQWLETKEAWGDNVSERFKDRYLDPIVPQMQLALSAIHELVEVMHQGVSATRDEDRYE